MTGLPRRRSAKGLNHGRRSRKFNQDCTICRSCRWVTTGSALPELRDNRHQIVGIILAPVSVRPIKSALLVRDLEFTEGIVSEGLSRGVAQVVFERGKQCCGFRNVVQGVSWHRSHAAR